MIVIHWHQNMESHTLTLMMGTWSNDLSNESSSTAPDDAIKINTNKKFNSFN